MTASPETGPPAENRWRRLARSTFFRNLLGLGGATLLNRLLGLLTLGYAARKLGPESYGLVGYGSSVAAYASILLSPGLATWGVRAVAQNRATAGRLLVIVNGTKLVLAVLGLLAVVAFAWGWLPTARERWIVLLSCLVLLTQALSADWVLNGLELPRVSAAFGVLGTLVSTLGLLALVHEPDDAYVVPLLAFAAGLVAVLPAYPMLLRRLGLRIDWPTGEQVRTALRASVPLGLTSAVVVLLHYANNFIVHGFLGEKELGVYLSAFRLVELAATVPTILAGAFFPRLARTVAGTPDRAVREAQLFARVHMVPAFLVAGMALVEAQGVIDLLYGAKYQAAVPLLRVMSLAVLFNYAICGYTNCLISFGRDRVMLIVVVVSAIVSIGGGLLLVPILGSLGAAITIALVDLAGWLVSLPAYRAAVGSLQMATWIRPLVGVLCACGASLLLQAADVPFLVRVPIALAVYAPVILLELRSALK